jgi:3-phenylpropionate/cinnamic acid dioxygenase small subunit
MSGSIVVASSTEAAEFLYAEARLLDDHDYDSWLELWDDAGLYWIPADGATDPDRQVSIIYDTRRRLGMRVAQLQTGYRHAQIPQSRTQHFITNVEVLDSDSEENRLVVVRSSYLVIEARFGEMQLWPGRATHELRRLDDGPLRIARKTVTLINNDLPLTSLAFLL